MTSSKEVAEAAYAFLKLGKAEQDAVVREKTDRYFLSHGIETPDPEERRIFEEFARRGLSDDGK